ncbi:glutathione S-transferase family protein [Paracoccus caeni]|uniref:Glutathione S-transferase family protein n=1 Tax=Paracoccus caeni TaxID=657651 RepID=A0A934SCC8_9RHOB|nr:glutathione S-transferase family protein [Paracoccus caeni]MBK4216246.1 glutathione S-transferase family protein [Paracoccus caeni]
MTLILTTYDWVPEFPRPYVRDIRIRWLLEELGQPYQLATVPLREKTAAHIAMQPFAQVPFIQDGDTVLFESGAILLHLAEGTKMMPDDLRQQVQQWLIAALNSVEIYSMAWFLSKFMDKDEAAATRREELVRLRFQQLQSVLAGRDWLTGDRFTVADLLMAEILRLPGQYGLLDDVHELAAYAERATARPAFRKALADQMAHWRAADEKEATA